MFCHVIWKDRRFNCKLHFKSLVHDLCDKSGLSKIPSFSLTLPKKYHVELRRKHSESNTSVKYIIYNVPLSQSNNPHRIIMTLHISEVGKIKSQRKPNAYFL